MMNKTEQEEVRQLKSRYESAMRQLVRHTRTCHIASRMLEVLVEFTGITDDQMDEFRSEVLKEFDDGDKK